jgi:hypothetical protein
MSYYRHESVTSFTLNLHQDEVEAKVTALISELTDALVGVYEEYTKLSAAMVGDSSNTETVAALRELLLPLADKFSTNTINLGCVLDSDTAHEAAEEEDPSYLTDAFAEVFSHYGNKVSLTADTEKSSEDCFSNLLADALLPVMEDDYQVRTLCWNESRLRGSNTVVVTKSGDAYSIKDLVALLPG